MRGWEEKQQAEVVLNLGQILTDWAQSRDWSRERSKTTRERERERVSKRFRKRHIN